MPHVAALYRYPVKGLTPEPREAITVLDHGRVAGDRVLAFRYADAPAARHRTPAGDEWWGKQHLLSLMEAPGLARLRLRYDEAARTLALDLDGGGLVETSLDDHGRERIAGAVTDFVRTLPEGPRLERRGRLPLTLVGDGDTARFQDRTAGYVTLHGRGSLLALGDGAGCEVDERRFRSNIAVDGLGPWDELGWRGRVRIGEVEFRVQRPIVRCVATHANPETGQADTPVLTTLTRVFGHEQPSFGVLLLPGRGGGTLHVGDEVRMPA